MNKWEKEVQEAFDGDEKAALEELKKHYQNALDDIDKNIAILQADELTQSKIYRLEHQKALRQQVSAALDKLQSDEYATISAYLNSSYTNGFVGSMYSLHGQGIPMLLPIDQSQAVRAILTDSKLSKSLYEELGVDMAKLKKRISAEISRGIATGSSYNDIARNIASYTKAPLSRATTIVRTEAHRITQASHYDAAERVKAKGVDIVLQWDASLDGDTRDTHRMLDGTIIEVGEYFESGGNKARYPGDFGDPAEDCNCRCVLTERARSALDEEELKTLQDRAEYFGLDQVKNFDDFKQKYIIAANSPVEEPVTVDGVNKAGTDMLAEIYETHRTDNDLGLVPYDELGAYQDTVVSADYGKVPVETAAEINSTMQELAAEYDTSLKKIRTMTKEEYLGNQQSFAYVSHNYVTDSSELVINPAKCGDLGELTERVQELSRKGYCVKIPDSAASRYIATHEFGHTLINMEQPLGSATSIGVDYKKIRKARKEINALYEEYMEEVGLLTAAHREAELFAITSGDPAVWASASDALNALRRVKLSEYSLQNADEFMAEAFTFGKLGDGENKYSSAILDILAKYFGR